jgi:hypothetical protein
MSAQFLRCTSMLVMTLGFASACIAHPSRPDVAAHMPAPISSEVTIPSEAIALIPELTPVTHRHPELLQSTGSYDSVAGRWRIVDVEHDLGERPRPVWLGEASVTDEWELDSDDVLADLTPDLDLVDARVDIAGALGVQHPLVCIGSWLLYVEGRLDVDVLHLFDRGGTTHHVLGERPRARGPLDEGGCRANPSDEISCHEIGARLSIMSVRAAPDGHSLLVQGYVSPPDHHAAGPFHWIVPLAESVQL